MHANQGGRAPSGAPGRRRPTRERPRIALPIELAVDFRTEEMANEVTVLVIGCVARIVAPRASPMTIRCDYFRPSSAAIKMTRRLSAVR